MQRIKKYTCRSVWIIILISSSTLLWAQNEPFHGGFGRGDTSLRSSLLACNTVRFSGGFGAGNTSMSTVLLNCNSGRFSGGFGKGDSSSNTSLLSCNTSRFKGGFGKGDSSIATTLLNCNIFRFKGDSASGFTTSNTNLLNCNIFRFSGDSADGAAYAQVLQVRKYIGNDTSITLICSNETFDLLTLYNSPDFSLSWSTPTPAIAGLGSYTLIATTAAGCKDTAITVLQQEITKWTGTVSNNWHDPANWSGGKVPNEKTHVSIPGSTPNPCQISVADAKAASVQGKATGSLSIINNRVLIISGTCTSLPIIP